MNEELYSSWVAANAQAELGNSLAKVGGFCCYEVRYVGIRYECVVSPAPKDAAADHSFRFTGGMNEELYRSWAAASNTPPLAPSAPPPSSVTVSQPATTTTKRAVRDEMVLRALKFSK